MPFLGREKGRPRSRRSDDEFVVFLQGVPAHCRWQELKDLVRQTALHIRQAVVYDDNHGFPTGLGQIIVKSEDEAWCTYHRLSTNGWDGHSLVVTLARTSAPTRPIAGPTRSPPAVTAMQNYTYLSGHSTPPSQCNMVMPPRPISPESIQSTSPTYPYPDYSMVGPMAMPPQHFMPMMPDPMTQPMQCFPPSPLMHSTGYDAQGWNMMPMYPVSPIQALHDTGDGFSRQHAREPWTNRTEPSSPTSDSAQRAVYMQTLDSASTTTDLKGLLDLDQRPGTARSGSWDEAMAASEDMNAPDLESSYKDRNGGKGGQDFLKKTVDLHKPLVVDGSGMQKRSLELVST